MRRSFASIAMLCFALLSLVVTVSTAAVQAPATSSEQSLSEMVRKTILENLPREITGENDWGDQKKVFSGLKIKTNDGNLRISKRTKEVNNGLWTQYRLVPVDPNQQLHVRVAQLHRVASGRVAFQLFLSARIEGEARVERWRRGIKMLNFKVDAQTTVETLLDCEMGIRTTAAGLTIDPKVNNVRLSLVDIDLERVSRLDGPAAQELGDRLRPRLEKELRSREGEVAQKINAAIEQHRDRLHISTAGMLALGWGKAQTLLMSLYKPSTSTEKKAHPAPAAIPAPPLKTPTRPPTAPAPAPAPPADLTPVPPPLTPVGPRPTNPAPPIEKSPELTPVTPRPQPPILPGPTRF